VPPLCCPCPTVGAPELCALPLELPLPLALPLELELPLELALPLELGLLLLLVELGLLLFDDWAVASDVETNRTENAIAAIRLIVNLLWLRCFHRSQTISARFRFQQRCRRCACQD
jgi:hypothetical protein